jgi:Poly A polymerase regulatory subunit
MVIIGAVILLIFIITVIFAVWPMVNITGGREVKFSEIDTVKNRLYFNDLNYRELLEDAIGAKKPILYLDDIPEKLPYQKFDDLVRQVHHIGQLKLFLTELQFLTDHLEKHDQKVILVYSGSSPSHKASHLSKMFPNLKIIMIDPYEHETYYPDGESQYQKKHADETIYFKCAPGNRFKHSERWINLFDGKKIVGPVKRTPDTIKDAGSAIDRAIKESNTDDWTDFIIKSDYKFYILEDFFTDETAEMFRTLSEQKEYKFLYASDIRSRMEEQSKFPSDLDIIWNSAMQYNWVRIMQPDAAMFKFRTPYFDRRDFKKVMNDSRNEPYRSVFDTARRNGINFIGDYKNRQFKYFDYDTVNIQSFAGQSSSESRLVASKSKTNGYERVKNFDYKDYEDRFFYYNRILRSYGFHEEHEELFDKELGFDACGDCGIAFQLFKNYYTKLTTEKKYMPLIKADIQALMNIIRRDFKEPGSMHGYYFEPYKNVQSVLEEQKNYVLFGVYKENEGVLLSAMRN